MAAVPEQSVRRIGRVSRSNSTRAALVAVETANDRLEKLLKSIARQEDVIARLVAENTAIIARETEDNNNAIADARDKNAASIKEIEQTLKDAKMQGYTDGVYRAEFVDTMTKKSREVDLVKLKAAVKPEIFMQCVKGSLAEMAAFLSEREIEAVCNTVGPKKTGTVLKVEALRKGKK